MLLVIAMLLIKDLKNTDAVLFDVRSNLGGRLLTAQWISHFFKIEFPLMKYHVLVNNYTREIRVFDGFASTPNAMYTQKKIYGDGIRPPFDMLYVKPVGVLVDSNCKLNPRFILNQKIDAINVP
jgi:hypothetical protein